MPNENENENELDMNEIERCDVFPSRKADYGLTDHKELLDRARRTETKLTNLITSLGVNVTVDGKASCEVGVRNGVVEVLIDAADTPISCIKAAIIKAGFDVRTCDDVRIMLGGSTFAYINFNN
jgi:hypothetical protein